MYDNNILYLYNVENYKKDYKDSDVIIYHGTNINEELKKVSNYIIPSTSFFEDNLIFSNLLGYSQSTNIALSTITTQFFSISELYLNLNNELYKVLSKKMKEKADLFPIIKSSINSSNLNNNIFTKIYPYSQVHYYYNNIIYEILDNNKQSFSRSLRSEFIEDYYKVNNMTLNSETLQKSSILVNNMKNNFFKNLRIYEYVL